MSTPDGDSIGILAERLTEARCTLVFTGAGISTGSGIPDFRGPKGLWKRWRPVYFPEFLTSHEARVRHWQFKLEGWDGYRDAVPNPGHYALADLERAGLISLVVTQNIDGLHLKAGLPLDRVIELHGTNLLVECVDCGVRQDNDPVYESFRATGEPPQCPACGGFLKPATVSFGQEMPRDLLERAFREASEADLAISVGSTLEVEPAASVPLTAKRHGAFYVVLNLGATAHDAVADLRIEADASEFLQSLTGRLGIPRMSE
jgi:NAD-dependent deacetylase